MTACCVRITGQEIMEDKATVTLEQGHPPVVDGTHTVVVVAQGVAQLRLDLRSRLEEGSRKVTCLTCVRTLPADAPSTGRPLLSGCPLTCCAMSLRTTSISLGSGLRLHGMTGIEPCGALELG